MIAEPRRSVLVTCAVAAMLALFSTVCGSRCCGRIGKLTSYCVKVLGIQMMVNVLRGETTLDVVKRRGIAKAAANSSSAPTLQTFNVWRVSVVGTSQSHPTTQAHTPTGLSIPSLSDNLDPLAVVDSSAVPPLSPSSPKSSTMQGESPSSEGKTRRLGMVYIPRACINIDSNWPRNPDTQIRTITKSSTLTRLSTNDYICGWTIVLHPHERVYDHGIGENWRMFWSGNLEGSWELSPIVLEKMKARIRRYEAEVERA